MPKSDYYLQEESETKHVFSFYISLPLTQIKSHNKQPTETGKNQEWRGKLDHIMQDQQKSDTHRETEREKFTYNFFVWEINLYLWTINVTSK